MTTITLNGAEVEVRRTCNRCYGHAVSVDEANIDTIDVVSRYGTAHLYSITDEQELDTSRTLCGIGTSNMKHRPA